MEIKRFYQFITEGVNYSSKNLITEVCVSMVLLNQEFLDNILDRGMKSRYTENSTTFLTDLKNLIISKNRLSLGKFVNGKCVEDDDTYKLTYLFDNLRFDIEKDWNVLNNSRLVARSIIDKLLPEQKLESDSIRRVYWLGPNKEDGFDEDIVLEMNDGKQYSFYLNKNISQQKTASFNTFMDDLIGDDVDKLYNDEYISKWNKLVQDWVKIIYENAEMSIRRHIDKFIDIDRLETLKWFDYFQLKHRDDRFKILGEHIDFLDKNILYFSDLMNGIWKNKDKCFSDVKKVSDEWYEVKIFILNSKILENLLTNSLKSRHKTDVVRLEDGMKLSDGSVKMKLFKTIIEKMGCVERPIYYISNNGNTFSQLPDRNFFRNNYDDFDLKFDYHVKLNISQYDEDNNFKIKIILDMSGETLIDMDILVSFSGGELNNKLSAKYKFNLTPKFNFLIAKKRHEDKDN